MRQGYYRLVNKESGYTERAYYGKLSVLRPKLSKATGDRVAWVLSGISLPRTTREVKKEYKNFKFDEACETTCKCDLARTIADLEKIKGLL